jgi:hypothetical protein
MIIQVKMRNAVKKRVTDSTKDKTYQLRRLAKDITNRFSKINGPDATSSSITAGLNQLTEKLIDHEATLNAVHMALIFNQLSVLPANNPDVYEEFLQLIVEKTNTLLSGKWTKPLFGLPELIQILCALSKLNFASEYRSVLIQTVLDCLIVTYEKTPPVAEDSAAILDAMAKLDVDLHQHQNLIKVLLRPFNQKLMHSSNPFAKTETLILATLWPFLVLANNQFPESVTINNLFIAIDTALKTREREIPTPSEFQKTVSTLVCGLVKEPYKDHAKIEYWIGSYPLDLAFVDLGVNVESDGPFHYHAQALIPLNQFRDKILNLYGWTVIRIPHFEWEPLTSREEQINYLRRKLSNQPSLFNGDNQCVFDDSDTALPPENKSIFSLS